MKTSKRNKRVKLPKLAWGNIENPSTALYNNQIAYAKAQHEASTDKLSNILGTIGNIGVGVGTQMLTSGITNAPVDGFLGKNKDWLNPLINLGATTSLNSLNSPNYAYGGEIGVPNAEVEGEEVAELPNGNLLEFQGNSHENGGIPIQLPQGTDVFSKRIKIDGVTLANRKKKRKSKQVTLEDLLQANPNDVLIKNSLMRTQNVTQKEEEFDENLQNVVSRLIANAQQQQAQNQQMQQMNNEMQNEDFAEEDVLTEEDDLNLQGQKQEPYLPMGNQEDYVNQMLNEEEGLEEFAYGGEIDDKRRPQKYYTTNKEDYNNFNEAVYNNGNYEEEIPLKKPLTDQQRKNYKNYNYWQGYGERLWGRKIEEQDLKLKQLYDIQNGYQKRYDNNELDEKRYNIYSNSNQKKIKKLEDEKANTIRNYKNDSIGTRNKYYDENGELRNTPFAYGGTIPLNFGNPEDEELFPEPLYKPQNPPNSVQGQFDSIDSINNNLQQNPLEKLLNKTNNQRPTISSTKVQSVPSPYTLYKNKEEMLDEVNKNFESSTSFDLKRDALPKADTSKLEDRKGSYTDVLKQLLKKHTLGDAIQLLGTYKGMRDPMNNVLENRAGDQVHTNMYANYGKEGLKKLDETKQFLQELKDRQLQQLALSRHQGIQRGRNSARSINTMNALNLATDFGINQAEQNAQSQYAQQLAQIMAQESQKLDNIDRMTMQGEAQADMNNRRDRDAFYTEKGKAEASRNSGIKEIGMSLNDMKSREFTENLMEQLSRYGLTFDENGQLKVDENYRREKAGQVDTGKAKDNEETTKTDNEKDDKSVSEHLNEYFNSLEDKG